MTEKNTEKKRSSGPVRGVWRFGLRHPLRLVVLMAVLAAVTGSSAGWLAWQHREQTSVDQARAAAVEAADAGAVAALSYDYRSIETDVANAKKVLTGTFLTDYDKLMTEMVLPAAKTQQTVTRASVSTSSVVSASPDTVEVLLFVNQTTTGTGLSGPKLDGSRVRMTMTKENGQWLISALKPV